MNKQNTVAALFALAILTVAPAVQAQIISVKFYSDPAYILGSAETAGADSAANWNNVAIAGNSTFTGTNMNDNSGIGTTLDFSFTPNGGGPGNVSGSTATGTTKLYGSGQDASNNSGFPISMTVTQIPYATYNLYVYVNAGFADRQDTFTVGGTTYYFQPNTITTSYTQATSTTPGVYSSANYVEFTGLTGTSLSFSGVPLNGRSTFYGGFQIEAVAAAPEPSTWALMGAGILALFGLRRFRKLV